MRSIRDISLAAGQSFSPGDEKVVPGPVRGNRCQRWRTLRGLSIIDGMPVPLLDVPVSLTWWDLVLILVVGVQTTVVAYVATPRMKSIFLTLPFPFTVVTLSVGLPMDAANVLALFVLFLYIHLIRALHVFVGVPIVPAIVLGLAFYCTVSWIAVPYVPAGNQVFWWVGVITMAVGAALFFGTSARAERVHRTRFPIWQKLPIVLCVVLLLIIIKDQLHGFATLFPLVGVVGAYEARHCLWTMTRTIPILMMTMVPLMAVTYLTQEGFGLGGGLLIGWIAFLVFIVPIMRWQWMRWPRATVAVLTVLALSSSAHAEAIDLHGPDVYRGHGLGIHDELKYGSDFTHFEYVNPDAPKGGEVRLSNVGTFDSLNPFILKGVAAAGTSSLIYSRLCTKALDEPLSEYGQVAETIICPRDRSWIAFQLRPEARWHDGEQVTADDVVFTFYTLIEKGTPFYRRFYADVDTVYAVNDLTVRFDFSTGDNRELPLIIGQLRIFPRHYWESRDFSKTTLEPPLGSGPYRIESVNPGRSITYARIPDHWSEELPVMKGRYNFDHIVYDYYRDDTVSIEAFKAGAYDFRIVSSAREWATAYAHPAVKRGDIVRQQLPHQLIRGMSGFVLNTRKAKFADVRVREALSNAFDFEWTNAILFYGLYTRTQSYFENSELSSAGGPPEGLELAILEEYRGRVPNRVFTESYRAPSTDGDGGIRPFLRRARTLLHDAGWTILDSSLVHEESNEAMEIEFLLRRPSYERVLGPVRLHLQRLGIASTIRTVDASQYWARLQEYDYDVIVWKWNQYVSPGNEQRNYWSSSAAHSPGSRNYSGIADLAVDELVERLVVAQDRTTQIAITKALDRVLLWGHYVIPHWHSTEHCLVYWDKFGCPDTLPRNALGFLSNWWYDAGRAQRLVTD
ncbi:MAG: extracellular solute-binding protein [Candidatus Latescibacterota bacterium]|nr:extracellular solute-binding protein [Candidatus Latescibacterota bacterium]